MPVKDDLLQVQEVTTMKLHAITISIAIALAGFAGIASAAGQSETLTPVEVLGPPIGQCTPPNDTTGHACDTFNQMVRANFSPREIGMLFGARTSYPEHLTGGIDRLQRRFQAVVQAYVAQQQAATHAAPVAVK
jgi:hypothetical protein